MPSCERYTLSFLFNDTATTEIYTRSLHDALPILIPPCTPVPVLPCQALLRHKSRGGVLTWRPGWRRMAGPIPSRLADRKSTRLHSSPAHISYAVFSLTNTRHT